MRISNCAFLINSAPARGGNWTKGLKVLAPFVATLGLALWPMEASASPEGELFKNDIWSGVYVGVGAGAGSFDYDLSGHATKPEDDDSYGYSQHIHASDDDWDIFGTVQIGIDRQIGQRLVIGAFADFDLYTDSGSSFSIPWDEHLESSLSGNVELDSVWSVGGRIGALVTPRILLYGMSGYTQANLDGNLTFFSIEHDGDRYPETLSVNLPDELHGYFVGAGGEIKLTDNMSLKGEYRYSDFDSVSASVSKTYVGDPQPHCGCHGGPPHEQRTTRSREVGAELDADLHAVRVTLVYKFASHDRPIEPLK
jgi:outer membrane immunogenic protein